MVNMKKSADYFYEFFNFELFIDLLGFLDRKLRGSAGNSKMPKIEKLVGGDHDQFLL